MSALTAIFEAWLNAWLYGALAMGLALGAARLGIAQLLWQREQSWRWVLLAPGLIMLLQLLNLPQLGRAGLQLAGTALELDWPRAETLATPEAVLPKLAAEQTVHAATRVPRAEPAAVHPVPVSPAVVAGPATGPGAPTHSDSATPSPALWQLRLTPLQLSLLTLLVLGLALGRLLRVLADWRQQSRRIKAQPLWAEDSLLAELRRLAERSHSSLPELRQAEDDGGPHAWSPATISLPGWMPRVMSLQQQRAALAHELAHLRRADPRWQLLYALHFALWPLPGAQAVRGRLDQLAERACDQWAAVQTGSRRAMAESLDAGEFERVAVDAVSAAVPEADLDALLSSFRDEGLSEDHLSLLARVYFDAGNYDKAIDYYRRLVDLEPHSIEQVGLVWERRRAMDRFNLGRARLRSGRAVEAVADLQTAQQSLGDDHAVLLELGVAAAFAGQLRLAGDALERAVRLNPESVRGWLNKARVHRAQGETNAAQDSYAHVLRLDPANAQARQELAALRSGHSRPR